MGTVLGTKKSLIQAFDYFSLMAFFFFRSPQLHKYDLVPGLYDSDQPTQDRLDELFIYKLDHYIHPVDVPEFLEYHFNKSATSGLPLLNHIEKLIQTTPYSNWLAQAKGTPILDWIEAKKIELAQSKNNRENIPIPFGQFLKNPDELNCIENKLLNEGVIDSNRQWKRKGVQLSSLMFALNELELYKDELLYLKPQEVAKALVIHFKSDKSFETIRKEPDKRHINKMLEILQKG